MGLRIEGRHAEDAFHLGIAGTTLSDVRGLGNGAARASARRAPRRRWARPLTVVAAALLALTVPSGARAETGPYTATANARLVSVDFTTVPPIAFDQLIDAGVSVAQAEVDSLGGTKAFASSPYPSNSIVLLPGLVAGVTAGQTSDLIPNYPLIASTNETSPSDHRELATVVLDAQSTAGNSRGFVTDGLTRAEAVTVADDSKVQSRAETTVSSIKLGSALSLDGIRTVAQASRTADGEVQRSSSFEVAALTILGQRIALTPDTLSILGNDTPLGLDLGGILGQLLAQLTTQGIDIDYVPAVETDDGVTAAGLTIDMVLPVPPELASGLKEAHARVTLGLASASVSSRATGAGPVAPSIDPASPPGAPAGPEADAFDVPAVGPASAPPDRITSGPIESRRVSVGRPLPVDISLTALYPVLVLAAVIGLGLVNLIRHLGVRSP